MPRWLPACLAHAPLRSLLKHFTLNDPPHLNTASPYCIGAATRRNHAKRHTGAATTAPHTVGHLPPHIPSIARLDSKNSSLTSPTLPQTHLSPRGTSPALEDLKQIRPPEKATAADLASQQLTDACRGATDSPQRRFLNGLVDADELGGRQQKIGSNTGRPNATSGCIWMGLQATTRLFEVSALRPLVCTCNAR